MHHLVAEETAADLAQRAHPAALGQRLLGVGVEVDEAQHQLAGLVLDLRHQLAARAELHLALRHLAFHQHGLAIRRLGNRVEVGFVLVAQRQVQHQVEAAADAQLLQFLGGGGRRRGRQAGDVDRMVHASDCTQEPLAYRAVRVQRIAVKSKRDGLSCPARLLTKCVVRTLPDPAKPGRSS